HVPRHARYGHRVPLPLHSVPTRRSSDLERPEPCAACRGTGAEGGRLVACPQCGGTGQIRSARATPFGQFVTVQTCPRCGGAGRIDRKSTRLNSSHVKISYAVFCLKKKK